MTVLLTISKTAAGSEVSDTLSGAGNTGLDLGQCANGSFSPIIGAQADNNGSADLYIRHDATVDPITDCGFYLKAFSGTYGGAVGAAADLTYLLGLGAASTGADATNTDGLSRGLHMDMSWNVSQANQFTPGRETTGQKRIFGKTYSSLDGSAPEKAFPVHVDSLSYWNGSSEIDATAPVTGKIGKSTDTALGNRCHIKLRAYLHSAATDGGVCQVDFVTLYSFTA